MMRLHWLILLMVLAGTGCSDGPVEKRKPTVKVRCTVRFEDGTVPRDAIVVFHPSNEGNYSPYRPRGRVEADGTTPLTTYTLNDGLPAGDYTITVVWPLPQEGNRDEERGEEVDQLGDRYSQSASSPLKRTIKPGDSEIEPLILSR